MLKTEIFKDEVSQGYIRPAHWEQENNGKKKKVQKLKKKDIYVHIFKDPVLLRALHPKLI